MTFDVQDDGGFTFTHMETILFNFCLHKEVRVVANHGSNWVFDPDSLKGESFLEVLDSGKETNISISLGSWRTVLESVYSSSDKTCAFFQYSMKIGRKTLGARLWKEPTAYVFWRQNELSSQSLKQFWKSLWLWGINNGQKNIYSR